MDINSVNLVGRLTKNIDVKYTTSGTCCGTFSIACNRMKAKDGTVKADFFDVKLYGKQAEALAQYLEKGKQVGVNGRLQQESWTGTDGQKHSRVVIIADTVQLLGGKMAGGNQGSNQEGNFGNNYGNDYGFGNTGNVPF